LLFPILLQAQGSVNPLREQIAITLPGTLRDVVTDSNGYVYISGATPLPGSNLWRSTDGGITFETLPPTPFAVDSLQPDPVTPERLYALGDELWQSNDSGVTWRKIHGERPLQLLIDPTEPRRLAAVTANRIFVSLDRGENWQALPNRCAPQCGYSSANAVDSSGSAFLIDSVEGLELWTEWGRNRRLVRISSPFPYYLRPKSFIYHPSLPGQVYSFAGDFFSLDGIGGDRLTNGVSPGPSRPIRLFAFPEEPDAIYAISNAGLQRAEKIGQEWKTIGPAGSLNGLVRLPTRCSGTGRLVRIVPEGVARSEDGGRSWQVTDFPGAEQISSGAGCAIYVRTPSTMRPFLAKLAPTGRQIVWSAVLDRDGVNRVARMVVDAAGEVTVLAKGTGTVPWIAKYAATGEEIYTKAMPGLQAVSLAADGQGNAYLAGSVQAEGTIIKLDGQGQTIYSVGTLRFGLDRPTVVAASATGEVFVGGAPLPPPGANPGSLIFLSDVLLRLDSSAVHVLARAKFSTFRRFRDLALDGAGALYTHFTKWSPEDLSIIYESSPLQTFSDASPPSDRFPDSVFLHPTLDGQLAVGMLPIRSSSLRHPWLIGAACPTPLAVAHLSADGTTVRMATNLPGCAGAVAAIDLDGAVYAVDGGGSLYRFPARDDAAVTISGVQDAFSRDAPSFVTGAMVSITGENFGAANFDLGLPSPSLPQTLGGVQVLVEGRPSSMFASSPGWALSIPQSCDQIYCSLQIRDGEKLSRAVPVSNWLGRAPGLLDRGFGTSSTVGPQILDGNVRNADGTANSASNPAAKGSTVTVYLNGKPDGPIYWPASGSWPFALSTVAERVDGFAPNLYQAKVRVDGPSGRQIFWVTISSSNLRDAVSRSSPPVGIYIQ
jgi:uncharacterized protein (TIGR03437 family)